MPLEPGSSRATISENIREMRHSGHPEDVSVAAALNTARKHRDAGGATESYPTGGLNALRAPHVRPKMMHGVPRALSYVRHHLHTGPIHSGVAGRTDSTYLCTYQRVAICSDAGGYRFRNGRRKHRCGL